MGKLLNQSEIVQKMQDWWNVGKGRKALNVAILDSETVQTYIYTNDYRVKIVVKTNGYLGGYFSCRKADIGEDWTRGGDLPDGDFSFEVWNSIMMSIVHLSTNGTIGEFKSDDLIGEMEATQ